MDGRQDHDACISLSFPLQRGWLGYQLWCLAFVEPLEPEVAHNEASLLNVKGTQSGPEPASDKTIRHSYANSAGAQEL